MTGDWPAQYRRMKRWQERVVERDPETLDSDRATIEHFDDLLAFFVNCFALRDWIDASGFKLSTDPVEGSKALRAARDIANGAKHYRLSPNKRSTANFEVFRQYKEPPFILVQFDADHGTEDFNGHDLVNKCVAEWERILTAEGLLPIN